MNTEINTILYATDMGDHMYPVFRFALEMAKAHKAKITMLHVVEPLSSGVLLSMDVYMPDVDPEKAFRDGMKNTLSTLQKRLDEFCVQEGSDHEADCDFISKVKVVSGKSAETINQQAESINADLIIVGTHTSPSISAHLLGSTARRVTQISRTPVLVIPVYED